MMRQIGVPSLFLLLILVTAAACQQEEGYTNGKVVITNSAGDKVTFDVEVPLTEAGFRKGLMYREHLNEKKGMLFAYPDSAERSFWMKNTLIPLDMLFIDETLTIRTIHHATPCTKDPCPTYPSQEPVQYVLEIAGNLTTIKHISVNDTAVITLK